MLGQYYGRTFLLLYLCSLCSVYLGRGPTHSLLQKIMNAGFSWEKPKDRISELTAPLICGCPAEKHLISVHPSQPLSTDLGTTASGDPEATTDNDDDQAASISLANTLIHFNFW